MTLEVFERHSHQLLFHILVGNDHLSKVQRCKLHYESVSQRLVQLRTECNKVRVRKCDHSLLKVAGIDIDMELDVDSVSVSNRDAVLLPPEFNVPRTSERVGTVL